MCRTRERFGRMRTGSDVLHFRPRVLRLIFPGAPSSVRPDRPVARRPVAKIPLPSLECRRAPACPDVVTDSRIPSFPALYCLTRYPLFASGSSWWSCFVWLTSYLEAGGVPFFIASFGSFFFFAYFFVLSLFFF